MSFDAVDTRAANIEIHGQKGSMVVPDPNDFHGDVWLRLLGGEWSVLEPGGARTARLDSGRHLPRPLR